VEQECYIIAVLGTSPGVLTELIWWLVADQRRRIRGGEIWTTGRLDSFQEARAPLRTGLHTLRTALAPRGGGWDQLQQALDEALHPLPEPDLTPQAPADLGSSGGKDLSGRLSVVLFGGAGAPLSDIRTPEEAELVAAQLHDRVRYLRTTLPESVELVGSMAGGRKTMSSALFSAFCLQARHRDRLVHILLDPRIEARLGSDWRYYAPTPEMVEELGIPAREQIRAYEIPFPLVRRMAQDASLSEVLDSERYEQIWPALRANIAARGSHRAKLIRQDPLERRWRLEITLDEVDAPAISVDLTGTEAQTYLAIFECSSLVEGEGAIDEEWAGWLEEQRINWTGREPGATIAERSPEEYKTREQRAALKRKLERLKFYGLVDFCLEGHGNRPRRYRIPAAAYSTLQLIMPAHGGRASDDSSAQTTRK
jgi:CRISPR-associated protein (TIGR02584 family)